MMIKRMLAPVAALALLAATTTACTTLAGAALGAGAGAAIGAGTGKGAGKGALIGTGVGAAAGAVYGAVKKYRADRGAPRRLPERSARRGIGGLRGPRPTTSHITVVAPAAGFFGGANVFGEHADVERAGGLVLVDVLAVGLIALHEVTLHAAEAARSLQPDENRL